MIRLIAVAFALILATSAQATTPLPPLHGPDGMITQVRHQCGAGIGAAAIVAALVPWQLNANATMITTNLEGQPLTRAACDTAGLAWNDSRNVCDWQATQEPASETITGAIAPSQPLTRAACDKAGLAWNDNRNVCDWQPTQGTF